MKELSQKDEGELVFSISTSPQENLIILDFGKKIQWFAISPEKALEIVGILVSKIEQLDKSLLTPKEKDIQISTLYCDGACSPNPGKGGYGAIFKIGDITKNFSKGFKNTTNNRMELLSVIEPLEEIIKDYPKLFVTVVTDSQYVSNAINQNWITNWVANNWEKSSGGTVSNIDLWKRLLNIMDKHSLQFEWIKGHNGHIENEECDKMAVEARSLHFDFLNIDEKYEISVPKEQTF